MPGFTFNKTGMYVQSTTETRSSNHCCRGKVISITYSECVSIALVRQHAKRMRRIYCHLCPIRLYNIFPHHLINGTIFRGGRAGGGDFLNIKCVFWFSVQLRSETCRILRRIHWNLIINIHRYYVKCGPGSSVGIATELRAGRSGIESRWGRNFPPRPDRPWSPPSLL